MRELPPSRRTMPNTTSRFVALDGMRGIAALIVMIFHITAKRMDPSSRSADVFGASYLVVDLFFVLSGFVIFQTYAAQRESGLSVQEYVLKRMIRLYPMFGLGVILGTLSLFVMKDDGGILTAARIFRDTIFNFLGLPCANTDEIVSFGSVAPTRGELFPTNPPLRSLFFELFSSWIFVFVYRLKNVTLLKIAAVSLIVFAGCGYLVSLKNGAFGLVLGLGWGSLNFPVGFPRVIVSFIMGIYIARVVVARNYRLPLCLEGGFGVFCLHLAVFMTLRAPDFAPGFYALVFVAVLSPALVLVAASVKTPNGFWTPLSGPLGWLSYPLYCVDLPMGRMVWRYGQAYGAGTPVKVALSIAVSVLSAIAAGLLVDEPVRRRVPQALFKSTVIRGPAPASVRARQFGA